MRRVGLWIALAALLVSGPRLVLVFLQVDGLRLPIAWEAAILSLTGIATGVVLTGGGMFIAHVLAHAQRLRVLLASCWALLLVFAVVLIAPMLVAGIRSSALAEVLSGAWQWVWAVTAVAAVEVLAGASMVAVALAADPQPARTRSQPSPLAVLSDALAQRITASIAQPVAVSAPSVQDAATTTAQHTRSAEQSGAFACRHCGRSFASVNARSAHERSHKAQAVASAQV
jgi:hypothetical protein